MKQRPILFSTEMVRAILDGRKTQTRRIVKVPAGMEFRSLSNPILSGEKLKAHFYDNFFANVEHPTNGHCYPLCPYGKQGDILYVRETFSQKGERIIYRANVCSKWDLPDGWKWKPSLFMPKEAARIFLKITNVRVERLNEITEEDAVAEGIEKSPQGFETWRNYLEKVERVNLKGGNYMLKGHTLGSATASFRSLWQSINGNESWSANPWVWVIEFEQIEKPE